MCAGFNRQIVKDLMAGRLAGRCVRNGRSPPLLLSSSVERSETGGPSGAAAGGPSGAAAAAKHSSIRH